MLIKRGFPGMPQVSRIKIKNHALPRPTPEIMNTVITGNYALMDEFRIPPYMRGIPVYYATESDVALLPGVTSWWILSILKRLNFF